MESKDLLCERCTQKLHYVKVPENHIVIDFDIKDDSGEKSLREVCSYKKIYIEAQKVYPL